MLTLIKAIIKASRSIKTLKRPTLRTLHQIDRIRSKMLGMIDILLFNVTVNIILVLY